MKILSRVFGSAPASSVARRRAPRRLELWPLEERLLPSVRPDPMISGGILIEGDANVNHITLLRRTDDIIVQEAPDASATPVETPTPYAGVRSIRLLAGGGNDVITVHALEADWNLPISIDGQGGYDTISLTPTAHSLYAIGADALVSIDGGGTGSDAARLVLYDQANDYSSAYEITDTAVDRPNQEGLAYSHISQLDLYTTETYAFGQISPHHIDIVSTAAATDVNLYVGLSATQINIGRASDGLGGIAGSMFIVGSGVRNEVNFNDQSNPAAGNYQLGSSSVSRIYTGGSAAIGYSGVGPVTFHAGAFADVFTMATISPSKDITVHGNDGADRLVGRDTGGTSFRVTGPDAGSVSGRVRFDSFATLQGGSGTDVFAFVPGQTFAGTIRGGVGIDFLDYRSFSSGVTVNLATGAIPGAARGVSSVEGILGTPYADKLTGNSSNNVLVGGGGKDALRGEDGRDLLIGGLDGDALDGGKGEDILISGSTSYDSNPQALAALLAEWSKTKTESGANYDYWARIDRLRNPRVPSFPLSFQSYPLTSQTVSKDSAKDQLTGGADADWFFGLASEILDREVWPVGNQWLPEEIG